MLKGDIVLIPFPFTDLSNSKYRPALVLIDNELDVTVAFISTRLKWKEETDLIINPTSHNGLKKKSLVRLTKIATVDKSLVVGLLGSLEEDLISQLNKNLKIILKLQ